MNKIDGIITRDISAPCGITEYLVITSKVTEDDVLREIGVKCDYYVVNHKSLRIFIPTDGSMAYALSVGVTHGGTDDTTNEQIEPKGNEIPKPKRNLTGSYKFVSVLLAVMISAVFFFHGVNVYAASSNLPIGLADDSREIESLQNLVFRTPTGDFSINAYLATAVDNSYIATAYSLLDPRPLLKTMPLRQSTIMASPNMDYLAAVLMHQRFYTLVQVQQATGLNVTQDQWDAAVQLAVWKHAATVSSSYKIQESSISDSMVRSLCSSIETWASAQVRNLPTGTEITNFIKPPASPKLVTSRVEMRRTDLNIMFGPYSISSNPMMELKVNMTAGNIVNNAGERIETVRTGETFYVVMPLTFGGSTEIKLTGTAVEYKAHHGSNRIWLLEDHTAINLRFNVSTDVGSNGEVDITLFDALTSMPLVATEITIRNEEVAVTVLNTDATGRASYQLPVGQYTATITTPEGFLEPEVIYFNVGFIGDIQTFRVPIYRREGIMSFYAIDNNTLASAGYAEAFILEDGVATRRIAFTEGECLGLSFEPGDYAISIYLTSGDYSVSGQVMFTVAGGTMQELSIPLAPNTPTTTVRVADTMNRNHWVFSFYNGSELLFEVNNNGSYDLKLLPNDNYQVMARTNDGLYRLPMFEFQTSIYDEEVVIPVAVGTETATFNFVDTVVKEPIPNLVVGLFDQDHKLITYKTADVRGYVSFEGLATADVYYVNILAAPNDVSGYSAVGNRFLGGTKRYTIELYSIEEIQLYTSVDTLWRLPNVVWNGPRYVYPKLSAPAAITPTPEPTSTPTPAP